MHGGLGKSNAVSRRLRRRINNTDAISQPRCGVGGRKFYRGKGKGGVGGFADCSNHRHIESTVAWDHN